MSVFMPPCCDIRGLCEFCPFPAPGIWCCCRTSSALPRALFLTPCSTSVRCLPCSSPSERPLGNDSPPVSQVSDVHRAGDSAAVVFTLLFRDFIEGSYSVRFWAGVPCYALLLTVTDRLSARVAGKRRIDGTRAGRPAHRRGAGSGGVRRVRSGSTISSDLFCSHEGSLPLSSPS